MQSFLEGQPVLPVGRKTRALLAMIALSGSRPLLRSRISEMLWSRRPEEQARASLRQEIHRLLEALGPTGNQFIAVSRDQIGLRAVPIWIDVREVMRATPGDPSALALYEGELLDDVDGIDPAYDAWLAAERERLRDRVRSVAEAVLDQQTAPRAVIAAAQQLLDIDRAHEGAWRALMSVHAARGERGMAIQIFERCRLSLLDLLDTAPSSETMRLIADIRAGRIATIQTAPAAPVLSAPGAGRPCIARVGVLPLRVVSQVPEDMHLGASLAAALTASLARYRWLQPVAPASVARLTGSLGDDTALLRNLATDYLVEGSIQRVGGQMRVSIQLLDLAGESHVVWAQQLDHEAADPLGLQDRFAIEVAGQIEPEIMWAGQRVAGRRSEEQCTPLELILRALPQMRSMERTAFMNAGAILQRAVLLAPDIGQGFAWLAYWHLLLTSQGWAEDIGTEIARAVTCAEHALQIDPQDCRSVTMAGHVRAFLQHRPREALALHERAIAINPSLGMAWSHAGFAHLYLGDVAAGEAALQRAKQISPHAPMSFRQESGWVLAALLRRDFESAVAAGRLSSELNPGFSGSCKPYLAALGHLDRPSETAIVRARLLAVEPHFTIERFIAFSPLRRPEDRALLAEGLRRAGVPEGESTTKGEVLA